MITSEDIVTITQNVLSTMLELDACPLEGDANPGSSDAFTGCVQISGEWQGAVVIQSSEELAKLFASRLFAMEVEELTEADVRDAFAEMTNMIGGNIKGQVPCPSFLSIPSVTTGQDFDFHLAGANIVRTVNAQCGEETLRILLCEEDKSLAPRRVSRK